MPALLIQASPSGSIRRPRYEPEVPQDLADPVFR
jgi:hypothetical protein